MNTLMYPSGRLSLHVYIYTSPLLEMYAQSDSIVLAYMFLYSLFFDKYLNTMALNFRPFGGGGRGQVVGCGMEVLS